MTRVAIAILLASVSPVFAEPVVTIRENGPAANRVDMVVLGDGYTARELLKFSTDVDRLIGPMFARAPYAEYASYFNVRRIDVTSRQSGVDHPERQISKDTALGATYFCGGFVELICVDHAAVNGVLERSVGPDERDVVIVLVNDATFGGGGGSITTASTDVIGTVNLVLHELGHSIGLLADEYEGRTCRTPPGVDRPEPNVTAATTRDDAKWAVWIETDTELPTTDPAPGVVGLYAGAANCTHLHRPTHNSMMRTIGQPFEAVNTEQLIKRFYNWVAPIDLATPAEPDLAYDRGQPIEFSVEPVRPADRDLEIRWTIDGLPSGTDAVLTIDTQSLGAGTHTIEVEVRDPTPAVRRDPQRALIDSRRWTLLVRPR